MATDNLQSVANHWHEACFQKWLVSLTQVKFGQTWCLVYFLPIFQTSNTDIQSCRCHSEGMHQGWYEFSLIHGTPYETRGNSNEQLLVQHSPGSAFHQCCHPVLPAGICALCHRFSHLRDLGKSGTVSPYKRLTCTSANLSTLREGYKMYLIINTLKI